MSEEKDHEQGKIEQEIRNILSGQLDEEAKQRLANPTDTDAARAQQLAAWLNSGDEELRARKRQYLNEMLLKDAQHLDRVKSRRTQRGRSTANTTINDYIAELTDMATAPLTSHVQQQRLRDIATVFSYLRDTHNAQTIGDAEETLRQGLVDEAVVTTWGSAGMLLHTGAMKAAKDGYPQLTDVLRTGLQKRLFPDLHK